MKSLFVVIVSFLSISFYGQNDTISIVKKENISAVFADKMNVVYRGLANPIKVIVPKGIEYTVSGPGLSIDKKGNYFLSPGIGIEVFVTVVYKKKDGKSVAERHKFKILNKPQLDLVINDTIIYRGCEKCMLKLSKAELKNAVLKYKSNSAYLHDIKFDISSIWFIFPDKKEIRLEGNVIDGQVLNEIDKLKKGDFIRLEPALRTKFDVFVPAIEIVIIE